MFQNIQSFSLLGRKYIKFLKNQVKNENAVKFSLSDVFVNIWVFWGLFFSKSQITDGMV